MNLNTSLSSSQAKFATWVEEEMPYLWPLFDFNKGELISGSVDEYCAFASKGEQIMQGLLLEYGAAAISLTLTSQMPLLI